MAKDRDLARRAVPVRALRKGLTALPSRGDRKAGMNAFIAKPVGAEDLASALRTWLPARDTADSARALTPAISGVNPFGQER